MFKTKRTYGDTWWGKVWIDTLERIDSDMLARGINYVKADRIKNVKIVEDSVLTSIKDRYYGFYDIKINLKKFSKEEIRKIKRIVTKNSSIATEVDRGNLPESLFELMEKEEIKLLPKKWEDFKSSCPCPDPTNPCTHLTAVYYMITNEIDKDPFILFKLKGFEFKKEEKQQKEHPLKSKFIDSSEQKPKKIPVNIDDFEFSFFKYDIGPLLSLLPDNPTFYEEGNFKTFIENIYKIVAQKLDNTFPEIENPTTLIKREFQLEFARDKHSPKSIFRLKIVPDKDNFELDRQKIINEISKNQITNFISEKLIFPNIIKRAIALWEIKSGINYFMSLPVDIDYDIASESFAFLNILSSTALGMVRANLYLPEVIFEANDAFSIRYIPFIRDEKIQTQLDKLKQIMPQYICHQRSRFLSEDGVFDLLSLFITQIIKNITYNWEAHPQDKIIPIFTDDCVFKVYNSVEKNTAQRISTWLAKPYNINKKDTCPLIRIEKIKDDDFGMFVDVVNKNNSLEPVTEYKKLKLKTEVSEQLIIASEYFKELKEIVDSKSKNIPIIPVSRISEIFLKTIAIFSVMEIEVILPRELQNLAFPKLQVRTKVKNTAESGIS